MFQLVTVGLSPSVAARPQVPTPVSWRHGLAGHARLDRRRSPRANRSRPPCWGRSARWRGSRRWPACSSRPDPDPGHRLRRQSTSNKVSQRTSSTCRSRCRTSRTRRPLGCWPPTATCIAYFYQENRQDVPLDEDRARSCRDAIISIEDYRFYEHGALDLKGTLRALVNNASDGQTQGGSSITQQLVKLTLVQQAARTKEQQRGRHRGVHGAQDPRAQAGDRATRRSTPRSEILEHYLNIAYFGDGAYGISAAAYHYFSVSPDKLNLTQAATLAGLVKNPAQFNPRAYPERALQRRNTVLGVMARRARSPPPRAEQRSGQPLGLKITTFPNGCVDSEARVLLRLHPPLPAAGAGARRDRQGASGHARARRPDDQDQHRPDDAEGRRQGRQKHVSPPTRRSARLALVEPGTGKVRALAPVAPDGQQQEGRDVHQLHGAHDATATRTASRPARRSRCSPPPRRSRRASRRRASTTTRRRR